MGKDCFSKSFAHISLVLICTAQGSQQCQDISWFSQSSPDNLGIETYMAKVLNFAALTLEENTSGEIEAATVFVKEFFDSIASEKFVTAFRRARYSTIP